MTAEITLRSLAVQSGISYNSLLYDLKRRLLNPRWNGHHYMLSVDDSIVKLILEKPDEYKKMRAARHRKFHKVKYQNKEYKTVSELARELGISRQSVYRLMERGIVESLKETS